MSDTSHPLLISCVTIAIVIALFLCLLFIIGAGVLLFSSLAAV